MCACVLDWSLAASGLGKVHRLLLKHTRPGVRVWRAGKTCRESSLRRCWATFTDVCLNTRVLVCVCGVLGKRAEKAYGRPGGLLSRSLKEDTPCSMHGEWLPWPITL